MDQSEVKMARAYGATIGEVARDKGLTIIPVYKRTAEQQTAADTMARELSELSAKYAADYKAIKLRFAPILAGAQIEKFDVVVKDGNVLVQTIYPADFTTAAQIDDPEFKGA